MDSEIITATIPEFRRLSGISRSRFYELLKAGELESIYVGARRLILIDSFRRPATPGARRSIPWPILRLRDRPSENALRCDDDHIMFEAERFICRPMDAGTDFGRERTVEAKMNRLDYDAAVAAFIQSKGITRCPTVCISPTQGSIAEADRVALQRLDADREARRTERRLRKVAAYRFGKAA